MMIPCKAVISVLEASSDACLVLSSSGCVARMNSTAKAIFSPQQEEVHVSYFLEPHRNANFRKDSVSFWNQILTNMKDDPKTLVAALRGRAGYADVTIAKLDCCDASTIHSHDAESRSFVLFVRQLHETRHDESRQTVERTLSLIFKEAIHPFLATDQNGVIIVANTSATDLFGWSEDDLVGAHIGLIYPERGTQNEASYRPSSETKLTAIRKDGTSFLIEQHVWRVDRLSHGDVFCMDVRKRPFEDTRSHIIPDDTIQLWKEEEFFEAITNSFLDPMFLINYDGVIQLSNEAATDIFGWNQEEFIGGNISMITGAGHTGKPNSFIENYLETEDKIAIGKRRELNAFRKDGSSFPIQLGVREFKSSKQGKRYFCAFVYDMSDGSAKREMMEALVDASFDPMFQINHQGEIQLVNKAATKIFGWSQDEFIGKNISMITGPDHAGKHDSYIMRYLQFGKKRVIGKRRELTAFRKDGSSFPIQLGVTEVKKKSAGESFFCGFVQDLSLIREKEEMMETLINSSFDPIFQINCHGEILLTNKAATEVFGWSRDEFIGNNIKMITGPKHGAKHDFYIQRYLKTGEKRVISKRRELRAFRKDGSSFPILLGVTECKTRSGESCFCGYVNDLSLLHGEKAKLAHQVDRMDAMINASFDPMFQINQNGIIQLANQAAIDTFGWTKDEFMGKNISMIAPGEHGENHCMYLSNYLTTGDKRVIGKRRQLNAKKKDGKTFPIELGVNEFKSGSGESFFCGFVKDLSANKMDAERLKRKETLTAGMINSACDAMFQINDRGIIHMVNQAAVDHFGWTRDEFLGSNINMIMPAEHSKKHNDYLSRYLQTGEKRVMGRRRHLTAVRKNGEEIPIELGLSEVMTIWNERFFCGFIRDIRREIFDAEELQEKERLMEGLIETAFDPLFAIDDNFTIYMVNSAVTKELGKTAHELNGSDFSDIMPNEAKTRQVRLIKRHFKRGTRDRLVESIQVQRKNGSTYHTQLGLTEIEGKFKMVDSSKDCDEIQGTRLFAAYLHGVNGEEFPNPLRSFLSRNKSDSARNVLGVRARR